LRTGQRFDPESGLLNYKNRYYSPDLGRFISRDAMVEVTVDRRDPQDLWFEDYEYVGDNPLRSVDPLGFQEAGNPSFPFGETSSLRPQWRKPNKGENEVPKKRENYDPASVADLAKARQAICEVAQNLQAAGIDPATKTHPSTPTADELKNPDTKYEWGKCQEAADACKGKRITAADCKHFYIRKGTEKEKDGTYTSKPSWAAGKTPSHSFGPFRNMGGGDVGKGDDIYIDVYCGVK
jgi:RHS repeat-associated protein